MTDLVITPEAQSSHITRLQPVPPVPSGQKDSKAVKVLAKGIFGERQNYRSLLPSNPEYIEVFLSRGSQANIMKSDTFLIFSERAFIGHFLLAKPSPQGHYLNSRNLRNQE